MKNRRFVFFIALMLSLLNFSDSFAQLNVKLLDLTSNSYSSGSSFFVNIGTQMQVTGDYTFEAWLYVDSKPSGASGYFPVIMDRRTVFSFFLIDDPSSTGSTYCLRFVARDNSDNIIASMRCDGNYGSTYTPMNLQDWYHVAVSRDGTTARLFVNGTIVDYTTDANFILSTPTGNAYNVGARWWGSYDRFIDGALDEVRYSDVCRYTINFTINTNTPPHDTTGDPNTVLLFNFDNSNLDNSTSANSYTASAHGSLTYANWDGFPTDKLPLPITYFKELSGEVYSKDKVRLSWATATEQNNRGFEIQRSIDGENWDSLGFVQGMGTSNFFHGYLFTDEHPKEKNYYRLKQMDMDGHVSFTHAVYISLSPENQVIIYPNPATGFVKIIGINPRQIQEVEIFDLTGDRIENLVLSNSNTIDISTIDKGVYLLKIKKINGDIIIKRFVKLAF